MEQTTQPPASFEEPWDESVGLEFESAENNTCYVKGIGHDYVFWMTWEELTIQCTDGVILVDFQEGKG